MSKTFKEAAIEHLSEAYDVKNFKFKEDDPLSCRAEFINAIDEKEPLAYLYDPQVPEIILTGISGFEDALSDPGQVCQILLTPCILYKGEPIHNLPDLIPPFSLELFPNKDFGFTVNLGDMIEETDDEDWVDDFNDNFCMWQGRRREFLIEQLWPVILELEGRPGHEGICLKFMKSCFVQAFYAISKPDKITGEYDVSDLWDIFGWTLDLWEDWTEENNKTENESEIIITKSDPEDRKEFEAEVRKLDSEEWDYNEEYFTNIE